MHFPNTNFRSLAGLVLLACAWPPGAGCLRGADARALDRNQAIRLAFENNRELAVAGLEIDRAKSRLRWAGRLDNPELEVSARDDGLGLDEGDGGVEVALSQRFPLTARLRREEGLRRDQVLLAEAELAEHRRHLADRVDRAWVELLATRERIRLERRLLELNEEIVAFLEKSSEQGESSPLDVSQAKLTGRTLEQNLGSLAKQERRQRLELNRILGLDPATEIRTAGELDLPDSRPPMEAELRTVLGRRPDHVLALAKVDEAEAAVALEESKRWEDVSVKLFVERERSVDEPSGLERNTITGVGISIPLPLRDRNEDGIEQAQIDRRSAMKEVEAARFHVRSECEEAFQRRLDAWKLAREASGEILQLAEKNLDEFREAQQQGLADFVQVQRVQEKVLEIRTAAVDAIAEYHRAAARVRFVTGDYPGLSVDSQPSGK